MNQFKQVSGDVIKYDENLYMTKMYSSASIYKKICMDDEKEFSISTTDIEIVLLDGNLTNGILITFQDESEENNACIDVLISDVLGSFISDWY